MRQIIAFVILLVAASGSAFAHVPGSSEDRETLTVSAPEPSEQAGVSKVTIRFQEMLCLSCARRLSTEVKKVREVKTIRFFKSKNVAEILFPSGHVASKELNEAIEQAGFAVAR